MSDNDISVGELKNAVRVFVLERDWGRYHNPKDLAESICIEAAELLQLFQWETPEAGRDIVDDEAKMLRVEEELADVVLYCLNMANSLEIDLSSAILKKLEVNKKKYPVNQLKGKRARVSSDTL